jgi:hypothetical protein
MDLLRPDQLRCRDARKTHCMDVFRGNGRWLQLLVLSKVEGWACFQVELHTAVSPALSCTVRQYAKCQVPRDSGHVGTF